MTANWAIMAEELKIVKTQLKSWEKTFMKEHNTKPTKKDIDASQEVKDLYKEYSRLKKVLAEKSTERPTEHASEVWGSQFCKGNLPVKSSASASKSKVKVTETSVMEEMGRKLLQNAQFHSTEESYKRSGKFAPFTNKRQIGKMKTAHSTEKNEEDSCTLPVFEDCTDKEKCGTTPNQIQLFGQQFCQQNTNIFSTRSETVCKPKNDYASPMSVKIKSSKIRTKVQPFVPSADEVCSESRIRLEEKAQEHCNDEGNIQDTHLENEMTPLKNCSKRKELSDATSEKTSPKPQKRVRRLKSHRDWKTDRMDDCNVDDENSSPFPVTWAEENDVSEQVQIDLDFNEEESNIANVEDVEEQSDENFIFSGTPGGHRGQSGGRSRGNGDGNFVKLNMRVKKFARGKGGRSGSSHKRFAWKQKMKSRAESYGSTGTPGSGNCFKCGEPGHWANKCKGAGKNKKVEKGSVDDTDFPTLQDAALIAKGVKYDKIKQDRQEKKSADQQDDVDSGDLDIERAIVRSELTCDTRVPDPVGAVYDLNDDGSVPDTPSEVYKVLRQFGHTEFREGQEEIIMRMLCGLSTLAVLSTGAGKSLTYQLPAYMYSLKHGSVALVISPLVSLMEDQVTGLPPFLKGACLHTNQTSSQREAILAKVHSGQIHFLLLSPEALVGKKIFGIHAVPKISFACIDEAHCVSEWSHHFRPSYLLVCKVLKERFGVSCMLGLTATATVSTACSVAQHLGIHDYQTATIRGSPVPDNLQLSVSKDENIDEALIELLRGDRFMNCDSIIIYCTRREQTERVATLIRTCLKNVALNDRQVTKESMKQKGHKCQGKIREAWDAETYHAGLSAASRKRVQNAFMSGRLRVVVATVAFGMGLDKSDVRGIIHYNMPKGFESYVQEIGRAGRDRNTAHCHVFLDPQGGDMSELKKHIFGNTVDRHTVKRLISKVFTSCKCRELHDKCTNSEDSSSVQDTVCCGHERAVPIEATVQELDMKEEGISTLLCYLELHSSEWLQNHSAVYGTASIKCYGGAQQLQQIAKKCAPVAVAIALEKRSGVTHTRASDVSFNVIEVSDRMGWASGLVKKELYQLQWQQKDMGGWEKSGVLVEFSDLAYHMHAPGDLTCDQLDDIITFLDQRIQTQEHTQLHLLQAFHDTLNSVAHTNCYMCADSVDTRRSRLLKEKLLEYFEKNTECKNITKCMDKDLDVNITTHKKIQVHNESSLRADIRAFICLYSTEHTLSGRAIARVFQGIASPCFPPNIWGRVRRFWRAYIDTDFNAIRQLATEELITFR